MLEEALKGFPVTMWKFKPAANKWSIHEVVIHLADSEGQSHVRCRMIIAEPGTMIPNHDEHQWSVALSYVTRDIGEALDAIRLVRRMNAVPHHIEQMKRTNGAWASRKAE